MRNSLSLIVVGTGLLATAAHADVLVHLKSGNVLRADRTWTEGDTLKVQFRTGLASFPQDAVAKIEQVADRLPDVPADRAPAPARRAPAAASASKSAPAASTAAKEGASETGPKAGPAPVELGLEEVKGEDAQTRMERLDALSLQTHRQLSIARRQGQSAETLKALEDRVDAINRERAETMKKLHAAR